MVCQYFRAAAVHQVICYQFVAIFTIVLVDVVAERKPVKVAEFIPVEFTPKTGEESKSYDLYKKARIVVPEDVYDSTHKVPWFEFDTKGKVNKLN